MHGNEIYNEISEQIEQGKGCIIFDFGLFSQFRLTDATMIFKFRLGEEQLPDMKLNHRYSNKCYYTITRKYGRRLSKCGYPYFFDLDENEPFLALLCITFGYELNEKKETADMVFPLSVQLTKDRPACTLMMKLDFDEGKIEFISHIREKMTGFRIFGLMMLFRKSECKMLDTKTASLFLNHRDRSMSLIRVRR